MKPLRRPRPRPRPQHRLRLRLRVRPVRPQLAKGSPFSRPPRLLRPPPGSQLRHQPTSFLTLASCQSKTPRAPPVPSPSYPNISIFFSPTGVQAVRDCVPRETTTASRDGLAHPKRRQMTLARGAASWRTRSIRRPRNTPTPAWMHSATQRRGNSESADCLHIDS